MSSRREEGNWKQHENAVRQQKSRRLDNRADFGDDRSTQFVNKARDREKLSKSECDEELLLWRIE